MRRNLRATLLVTLISAVGLAGLSCGGDDDSNPVNPGPGANVTININGQLGSNSYAPSPDTVTVGQRVAWRNNNGTAHTATAAGSFNTASVGPGASSAAIQMNTAGSFSYNCTIHPTMTGTLVVIP